MNSRNSFDDRDIQFHLYRHVWVEAGETKEGSATSHRSAQRGMENKLSRGLPAWIVPVTRTEYWNDDDIPF